ncbi:MAG: GtrA family protein [Delftia acidovorans]|jgi:putative flippase GtrA|nr:GtrA family protein [Delftia acidovorans]
MLRRKILEKPISRFLIGGVINTGVSYSCYLLLKMVFSYQLAYALSYVIGILFSYWFNAKVVFSVPMSWRGFFAYPLVYVVQYLLSALMLEGIVVKLSIKDSVAPLLVTIIMVPVTFSISKAILTWKVKSRKS